MEVGDLSGAENGVGAGRFMSKWRKTTWPPKARPAKRAKSYITLASGKLYPFEGLDYKSWKGLGEQPGL
jgi:hypothetical protein